ncbi:MAG: CDP-glucose 4,6-dehydratase [Candidatus Scalindua sp.]|nr:CDP-glucose 4,6-dehydratase [Candidatus Scalindua sp.]
MSNIENFYKGKTVLVTGDTGFKGSWLALWLSNLGAKVYGYALPADYENDHFNILKLENEITHIDGNILDYEKMNRAIQDTQPEIVFHLAAQALVRLSYVEPKLTFETNVTGSVNILECVRESNSIKSLIYVTSDKCYKNKEWIWGYRENDELGGHDPYSASKAAAENVFSSYRDSFFSNSNVGLASVRAGNVIGGGDWALDRIIPDCIRSIKNGKEIIIRNPQATRPWQHVLEPLSGYMLLAQKLYEDPRKYAGSWNFGPTIESIKTVKELAETTINIMGKGSIVLGNADDEKHEAGLLHLNCDKSNHQLKWTPVWNFDETVLRTIEWYKKYLHGNDPKVLSLQDIHNYVEASNQ